MAKKNVKKNVKKNNANNAAAKPASRPAAQPRRQRASFREYLKGVKLEMKKVVWPTKKELGSYTVIVLVICAFFGIAFWAVDTGFLAVLRGLLGITM